MNEVRGKEILMKKWFIIILVLLLLVFLFLIFAYLSFKGVVYSGS